jgi:hypothetical protein
MHRSKTVALSIASSAQAKSLERLSTLHAVLFEALNERDHFMLFSFGHLELRKSRSGMTEKHVPVTFANAHAFVDEHHVSATIVHWAACARAKKVDEELLFAHYTVLPAMRPETPELRIGSESWQQIICHRGNGAISTETVV